MIPDVANFYNSSNLSTEAKTILLQCQSAISNYNYSDQTSVANFRTTCDNLIENALNSIPTDAETRNVVYSLSIYKASALYWSNNFNNFISLVGNGINFPNDKKIEYCQAILSADGAGAVKAVLVGGIESFALGGPLGVVAVATIGGSLGSLRKGISIATGWDPSWLAVLF